MNGQQSPSLLLMGMAVEDERATLRMHRDFENTGVRTLDLRIGEGVAVGGELRHRHSPGSVIPIGNHN
jgi:hypothetical protein